MTLSIGDLSRLTGVKIPTIRHYEQVGLMPSPARTDGRHRSYEASHVHRLDFIRQARDLGFGIDAVRELLDLDGVPDLEADRIEEAARRHLADVERRVSKLLALKDELTRMVEGCGRGLGESRIVEVLTDHLRVGTEREGERAPTGNA